MLTLWSWKTGKCLCLGEEFRALIFFAREVRVTQSSVVYHPKSCSGGSCLAAFHEFWLLLLQLLICNQAWGIFMSRKAVARWICSRATVPAVSSSPVWYFSIWRENVHKRNTLLGASTFGMVSANCSWWCFSLCCYLGPAGQSLATKQFGPKILRLGDTINTQLLGSYLLSLLNTTLYPKIWPVYGFLMSWRDKLRDAVL